MTDYEARAQELFDERWFPDDATESVALAHDERADVLVLVDCRQSERRDKEWIGFRNYLYGWEHAILAERADSDYALMIIDASHDSRERLAREFQMLISNVAPPTIPPELVGDPRVHEMVENFSHPERRHRIWGRVVVENGKPIGLMVDGQLVRQPVAKHWTELADEDSDSGSN